jgi:hypothetical protein
LVQGTKGPLRGHRRVIEFYLCNACQLRANREESTKIREISRRVHRPLAASEEFLLWRKHLVGHLVHLAQAPAQLPN